ncbi:hypothetical protein DY000_02041419 [Brassica cretica]|uniref:Uncharacterized protein n=1 Tax=Brassica cretica TaxID=69181 RepID=A0ABQ7B5U4_BRACR|nr:hypothetical protein DY000_02041419 [Brassica cretica]
MAKNINSVSITVLLFVLLVACTEILKSEAQTFCFECGPVPFLGTNADCFNCCKTKYGSPPVVSGVVEGIGDMSVCLCSSFFCFPIKHQGQKLSLLCPKFTPMLCVLLFHYEYKKLFCVCVPRLKILKSEAQTFWFECGPVPFLGTNADCFNCCKTKYGSPPVVSGVVEGTEKHCHCYC